MSTGELIHIPLQMFLGHAMIGAIITTFQQCPEAFDPIGMRHTIDILFDRMLGRTMQ